MNRLSIALAVYNEEKNIERCLLGVEHIADEIIIVDGGSTDRTVEIARKYTDKIIITDNPSIFHINKQKAINATSGDWILQLDADEVPDEEQKEAIKNVLENESDFNAFYLKRKNYFLGKWLRKGGLYPDPVIRFFKREKAYLPCKSVHEQMEVEGKTGTLAGHLLHFTNPTLNDYLRNSFYRYGKLRSKEMAEKGVKKNFLNTLRYCVLEPKKTFFSLYIMHKGFMDGWRGFIFDLLSALQIPYAFIKLKE